MPKDWLNLTTHRLDIYDESLAKNEFLTQFENLYNTNNFTLSKLSNLPTAYDYIRLGHPLSCILEWAIASKNNVHANNVISFDSRTAPILAILRSNLLANKNTQIVYTHELPNVLELETLKTIYGYNYELKKVANLNDVSKFNGSIIAVTQHDNIIDFSNNPNIDFTVNIHSYLGSVLLINEKVNNNYISEVQHFRRRETIAMTPINTLVALQNLVAKQPDTHYENIEQDHKNNVQKTTKEITGTRTTPLVASSGLSMQYAIVMGLIDDALTNHKGKEIKIIVPPNCYGGTNDQARRVADAIENVEVVDLPVDGGKDMVDGINLVLDKIAHDDGVPFIIAEIPTNPRVEVPNLNNLRDALSKVRKTKNGNIAVDSVFILDQTFCPNVQFLGENEILSNVRAISYASGSKFPSGGKCTAGYCVSNEKAKELMPNIEKHLLLCDNEATALQYAILASQMPSMNQRIADAYVNTRDFVNYIHETLPTAKINFVSEELASKSFTPSVFSLDLPTKGDSEEEKETYKRTLNLKLINLMIEKIPNESKFCVSYGQLKGCYWTVPATSTQGTTKEGDKDYIVRIAISGNLDLELHKKVFKEFVDSI
jgi:cystathionine beta-lyase/cystathionine gamma-synthase